MKVNISLITICLIIILIVSFGVIIQKQKEAFLKATASRENDSYDKSHPLKIFFFSINYFSPAENIAVLPAYFPLYSGVSEKTTFIENTSRTEILRYIQVNPGVQFRAICSSLGLSIGVVQFHLAVLQKNGLIKAILIGKYKRFFASGKFSRKEMEIIATLKLETVKKIIKTLLERKTVPHHELATKLHISSQGLTWQINRLQQTGLISENRNGLKVSYSLKGSSIAPLIYAMHFVENINEQ